MNFLIFFFAPELFYSNAVAIKRGGRIVGHVPENISFLEVSLPLSSTSMRVEILGPL